MVKNMTLPIIIIFLTLVSCGPSISRPDSLVHHQPMVISVSPSDGEVVTSNIKVSARFSSEINPASISNKSFGVIKIAEEEVTEESVADISELGLSCVEGGFEFSDDWREVIFKPSIEFEFGARYQIIVTPLVANLENLPLNQSPGNSPKSFISSFTVISEPPQSTDENITEEEKPSNGETLIRPSWLVLNEILYDASVDETDGNLFVELAGEAEGNISEYSILFINGSNGEITGTISIDGGEVVPEDGIYLIADSRDSLPDETNIAEADLLKDFDPQNGPDSVQLLDENGALLDSVGYGTGLPVTAANGLSCFESSSAGDAAAGRSISRADHLDSNNNATDFVILETPTPGLP